MAFIFGTPLGTYLLLTVSYNSVAGSVKPLCFSCISCPLFTLGKKIFIEVCAISLSILMAVTY